MLTPDTRKKYWDEVKFFASVYYSARVKLEKLTDDPEVFAVEAWNFGQAFIDHGKYRVENDYDMEAAQ